MIEITKQQLNLALGLFTAAAIVIGPIMAAIATATFLAGMLVT